MSTSSNFNPTIKTENSPTENRYQHEIPTQVDTNSQLELFTEETLSEQKHCKGNGLPKFLTSPSLFPAGKKDRMASALVIWGASDILTQRGNLVWDLDSEGKLCLIRSAINNKGEIHYWVTDPSDLSNEYPATLAGTAALATLETFDIRAACMHLIYAGHATKLERPWEQEFVIDDRQIEDYLGLNKRKDKTRAEKLALIEKLASQPCQITTFISWPAQGKIKAFTVSETRLWQMVEIQRHYQGDLFSNRELIGLTFRVRAGYWAKYFLNAQGAKEKQAYYQCGTLSKHLLQKVMQIWQHRPGAARLLVWLLFKTKFEQQHPITGQTLMEVAYGKQQILEVRKADNKKLRQQLADNFELDLLTIAENDWLFHFDPETYPCEIQPCWAGRGNKSRPRGYFARILAGRVWIMAPNKFHSHDGHAGVSISKEISNYELTSNSSFDSQPSSVANSLPNTASSLLHAQPQPISEIRPRPELTGEQIKEIRKSKGWTTRQLAKRSGLSQSMISMIETGQRLISSSNLKKLKATLELSD